MKPATTDMLRAHLLVASLTAAGTEALLAIALPVLPVSQVFFASTPFRLLALALIVGGVVVARKFAHAAFALAVKSHRAVPTHAGAWQVAAAADCRWQWLVVLHLRLTGQPFVLAAH